MKDSKKDKNLKKIKLKFKHKKRKEEFEIKKMHNMCILSNNVF